MALLLSKRAATLSFGAGGEIEHILHLGHVADYDAIYHGSLFIGMDGISVKIRGALLKFGKILDRTEAAFGAVDLLLGNTA